MVVGGFPLAVLHARPAAANSAAASPAPAPAMPEPREGGHFRQISAISPGSLASAYQAIRAQEAGMMPPVAAGAPAILSGLGIPAALSAYAEMSGEE